LVPLRKYRQRLGAVLCKGPLEKSVEESGNSQLFAKKGRPANEKPKNRTELNENFERSTKHAERSTKHAERSTQHAARGP
jgi:hypothetical protein